MRKTMISAVAAATAGALLLAGCQTSDETPGASGSPDATDAPVAGQDITLWLAGTDTPEVALDYLKSEYTAQNGGTLTVEQLGWGDLIPALTTALPDPNNTPDVFEVGNTQAPTFTTVGAFLDITDMYEELGGENLLKGFVDVGSVGDAKYALPYYFGSRMVWYRKDLYAAGGQEVPTTLGDFTAVHASLKQDGVAGVYLPGQDWRGGISWIFAHGGDIAKYEGGTWVASLSSPESIEGMKAWQELFVNGSVADSTTTDAASYQSINDEFLPGTPAASTLAPNWAYWSLGDLSENDEGTVVATWNDEKFGAYALPGVDGGLAPVFAGGSNIGISAASKNVDGAKDLMRIIFSDAYQTILAENGLGPANKNFGSIYAEVAAMGEIGLAAADASKLTPAAAGWTAIEDDKIMEQYFQAVAEGGDVAALAAEYDAKINAKING